MPEKKKPPNLRIAFNDDVPLSAWEEISAAVEAMRRAIMAAVTPFCLPILDAFAALIQTIRLGRRAERNMRQLEKLGKPRRPHRKGDIEALEIEVERLSRYCIKLKDNMRALLGRLERGMPITAEAIEALHKLLDETLVCGK